MMFQKKLRGVYENFDQEKGVFENIPSKKRDSKIPMHVLRYKNKYAFDAYIHYVKHNIFSSGVSENFDPEKGGL